MNKKYIVEKTWTTKAGYQAVCIKTSEHPQAHRCGYVAAPLTSKIADKHYYDVSVEVHGGLTFGSPTGYYPLDTPDVYWYGFDCAHWGDITEYSSMFSEADGVHRSLEFVVEQCESLAKQLKEKE